MEEKKKKNEPLSRAENARLRAFKKQAKQFPYLAKEREILINGWKSQEAFKNLRLLRNLLALFLFLVFSIRFELNGQGLLVIVLMVFYGLLFLSPLLVGTEKSSQSRYFLRIKGTWVSDMVFTIIGLILLYSLSVMYASSLLSLIFPKTIEGAAVEALEMFFSTAVYIFSPLIIIFTLMGAWHVIQGILLVVGYLIKKVTDY